MADRPKVEAPASPDLLASKPTRGAGVRRLNRIPVMLVVGFVAVILAVMGYTLYKRTPQHVANGAQPRPEADASPSSGKPVFAATAPTQGVIEAATAPELAAGPGDAPGSRVPGQGRAPGARSAPVPGQAAGGMAPVPIRDDPMWKEYESRVMQVQFEKLQAADQALKAKTAVDTKSVGVETASTTVAVPASAQSMKDAIEGALAGRSGGGDLSTLSAAATGGLNAPNGQSSKRDFLNQQADGSDYLKAGRMSPISPYEVKAGTVIPATMIGGINSDLPGQLLGQVSENVYDSATGQYLLIPQGAKLIGKYDNGVTFGQQRVLVKWERVIYPDASFIDLGAMPGTDESGYAGFTDKVDNHLLRLFSQAFMLSIFSAGIQLGQPQASSGSNYNSTQIIAAAMAQQMGELGMEIVRRNMDIAPTLEIRPGYDFNVMVTKDMIIRPWTVAADDQ